MPPRPCEPSICVKACLRTVCALFILVTAAACGGGGGGGGGTPTAPAPTVSSIAMTVAEILLVGRSATATATATMSNGQTQALTAGWQSSATNVATVTDAGTVRGVANGTSSISISSGGQQASRTIRVAPDYDGRWDGVQIVTVCRDSGELRGICQDPEFDGVIGSAYPISLTARHSDSLDVAGEFVVEQINFPTFTTNVQDDGTIRFASVTDEGDLRAAVSWTMLSANAGRASGTIVEIYSFPSLAQGELVWESTFSDLQRGTVRAQGRRPPASARARLIDRLRQQIRR